MPDERLEVSVTFDERGYIGSAPELRQAVVALSLGGLRRKIEALLLPAEVEIVLQLDGLAERPPRRKSGFHNGHRPACSNDAAFSPINFRALAAEDVDRF
jgi:hypothetical protein